jgi:hypothetical protein
VEPDPSKHLKRFKEGVVNGVDADGRPFSVRQTTLAWDAASGSMPVKVPDVLGPVAGPASLLCHAHDENLWNMRAILVKGKLERRGDGWAFVGTKFDPPSPIALIMAARKSAKNYLEKRGLEWPKVNFDSVAELWKIVDAKKR